MDLQEENEGIFVLNQLLFKDDDERKNFTRNLIPFLLLRSQDNETDKRDVQDYVRQ